MSKVDKAVLDRRLKPIYEALDLDNTKQAIQEANKVLKKHPNTPSAKLLKALALIHNSSTRDEGIAIVNEMDQDGVQYDETSISVFTHCYKDAHLPDRLCTLFERVITFAPTEEYMTHLFMAYVRVRDYSKQQSSANRLFRRFQKPQYFFWLAMSVYMQGVAEPEKMFFSLAERMLDQHFAKPENSYEFSSHVDLHIMIMEQMGRYEDAVELLSSQSNNLAMPSQFTLVRRLKLLLEAGDYKTIVDDALKDITPKNCDDWSVWKLLFAAVFNLLEYSEEQNDLEEYDRRIREVCKAVNERCVVDCSVRGPFLARLELLSLFNKAGITTHDINGEPIDLLIGYIRKFFKKPCCFIDVAPYLKMITPDKRGNLFEALDAIMADCKAVEVAKTDEKPKDSAYVRSTVLLNRLQYRFGLIDDLSTQQKRERICQLFDILQENNEDILAGSDLVQLMATILWKDWMENDDWEALYECILLLEYASSRFRKCAFSKLMLCRAYCETGNLNRVIALVKDLDIKSVQRDTLGYISFSMYELCGRFGLADIYYSELIENYRTAAREISECMVTGYKNIAFAQLPELCELYVRMTKSAQSLGAITMNRYFKGILNVENFQKSMQILHGGDTVMDEYNTYDNRDLTVIPHSEPSEYEEEIAAVREKTQKEFLDFMELRDMISRAIGAIGVGDASNLEEVQKSAQLMEVYLRLCRNLYPPNEKASRIMHSPPSPMLSSFVNNVAMDLIENLLAAAGEIAYATERGPSLLPSEEEVQESLEGGFPASDRPLSPFCQFEILVSASRAVQYLITCDKIFEVLLYRLNQQSSNATGKKKKGGKTPVQLKCESLRGAVAKSAKVLYTILASWKGKVATRSDELFPELKQGFYSDVFFSEVLQSQETAVRRTFCESYVIGFGDLMTSLENVFHIKKR